MNSYPGSVVVQLSLLYQCELEYVDHAIYVKKNVDGALRGIMNNEHGNRQERQKRVVQCCLSESKVGIDLAWKAHELLHGETVVPLYPRLVADLLVRGKVEKAIKMSDNIQRYGGEPYDATIIHIVNYYCKQGDEKQAYYYCLRLQNTTLRNRYILQLEDATLLV